MMTFKLEDADAAQRKLVVGGGRSAYLDALAKITMEQEIASLKRQLATAHAEITRLQAKVGSRFNLPIRGENAPQPIHLSDGVMILPPGAVDPDLARRAQERADEQLDRLLTPTDLHAAGERGTGLGFLTSSFVAEQYREGK